MPEYQFKCGCGRTFISNRALSIHKGKCDLYKMENTAPEVLDEIALLKAKISNCKDAFAKHQLEQELKRLIG